LEKTEPEIEQEEIEKEKPSTVHLVNLLSPVAEMRSSAEDYDSEYSYYDEEVESEVEADDEAKSEVVGQSQYEGEILGAESIKSDSEEVKADE
jgi:hypothetical protein